MSLQERKADLHFLIDSLDESAFERLEAAVAASGVQASEESRPEGVLGFVGNKPFTESDLEDRFRRADEEEAEGDMMTVDELRGYLDEKWDNPT